MKIWLITDTHFNHAKLIEYGRPVDFEDQLKANLERLVSDSDILIHLGDISMGKDLESNEWFGKLGARRWLLIGNHDNKSASWYMSHGWDMAAKRIDLEIYGKRIALSHMPLAWDGYFDINIHGHFHNTDGRRQKDFTKILSGYNKLLAVEYTEYRPVTLESFIARP